MGAGVRKTIVKTKGHSGKASKSDRLEESRNNVAATMTQLNAAATGNPNVMAFRDEVNKVLKSVSKQTKVIYNAVRSADTKNRSMIMKAFTSNNLEFRYECIGKLLFEMQVRTITDAKNKFDLCLQTATEVAVLAVMAEFGEESGSVAWKRLSDVLTGDTDGDEVSDLLTHLSTE